MLDPTTITVLVTFFTVVAGLWRAERQRKWDVEDRATLAKNVIKEAKVIEDKIETVAIKVNADSELAKKDRMELKEAINDNTNISTEARDQAAEAQRVANHMNQKIESLGISHNQIEKEKVEERKDSKRVSK